MLEAVFALASTMSSASAVLNAIILGKSSTPRKSSIIEKPVVSHRASLCLVSHRASLCKASLCYSCHQLIWNGQTPKFCWVHEANWPGAHTTWVACLGYRWNIWAPSWHRLDVPALPWTCTEPNSSSSSWVEVLCWYPCREAYWSEQRRHAQNLVRHVWVGQHIKVEAWIHKQFARIGIRHAIPDQEAIDVSLLVTANRTGGTKAAVVLSWNDNYKRIKLTLKQV